MIPRSRAAARLAAAALLLALSPPLLSLGGCSLFGRDRPKPTPLKPVEAKIAGRQVWTGRIDRTDYPLQVTVRGDRFVLADGNGSVMALSAADGREAWRGSVGERISAGAGSDGRYASVVTRDNELVTLDEGKERWRAQLAAPVATAPLVAGGRVFVLGIDRAVHAFDAEDGHKLWTMQRPGDALTLVAPGVIAAYRDTLLVGQGSRLASVDPLKGVVRWEVVAASPRGTNEVERLADLVGPPNREGDSFCMRAFQAAVACVDAGRAAIAWSQNAGGQKPVGGDAAFVFAADATDRITARRRANGEVAWTNESFLNRALSAPASTGSTVAFGDIEGYVHFLDRESGNPVLRLPTDGSEIVAPPVVSGTTMLVVTRRGGLFAFRPE
jgi:outer membrane protein assembly factor BamB